EFGLCGGKRPDVRSITGSDRLASGVPDGAITWEKCSNVHLVDYEFVPCRCGVVRRLVRRRGGVDQTVQIAAGVRNSGGIRVHTPEVSNSRIGYNKLILVASRGLVDICRPEPVTFRGKRVCRQGPPIEGPCNGDGAREGRPHSERHS